MYYYISQIMYNKQKMGKWDILGITTLLKTLKQDILIHDPFNHFIIYTQNTTTVIKITNFIKTLKNTILLNYTN